MNLVRTLQTEFPNISEEQLITIVENVRQRYMDFNFDTNNNTLMIQSHNLLRQNAENMSIYYPRAKLMAQRFLGLPEVEDKIQRINMYISLVCWRDFELSLTNRSARYLSVSNARLDPNSMSYWDIMFHTVQYPANLTEFENHLRSYMVKWFGPRPDGNLEQQIQTLQTTNPQSYRAHRVEGCLIQDYIGLV
jgi:hypothetical protein